MIPLPLHSCDAVCMGCIMPLVESGTPPEATSKVHIAIYLFSLGSCLMFFIMSLWFCLIVTRRLHEHTAAILERKLFADTEELQKVWQDQIENGLPTDHTVMNLLNQVSQEGASSILFARYSFDPQTFLMHPGIS